MKASELQAEIEESLLRGLELWFSSVAEAAMKESLRGLMRERARNLAMGLASRTLSESVASKVPSSSAEGYSHDLIDAVILDLAGAK